jgi:F-type H+-transporting ATPase subunit beta
MSGTVAQVIGAVVDCSFPKDKLPALFSALTVKVGEKSLTLEVQQHMDNAIVRAVAMGATDGLRRGSAVTDTKLPITVPVGPETLGRMFDCLGEPIDGLSKVTAKKRYPIHRDPPPFSEQATETEILETGIKVIDLICPILNGGKV